MQHRAEIRTVESSTGAAYQAICRNCSDKSIVINGDDGHQDAQLWCKIHEEKNKS